MAWQRRRNRRPCIVLDAYACAVYISGPRANGIDKSLMHSDQYMAEVCLCPNMRKVMVCMTVHCVPAMYAWPSAYCCLMTCKVMCMSCAKLRMSCEVLCMSCEVLCMSRGVICMSYEAMCM